ncbi:MAG: MgtC/SapB family protein [Gammaproteobacteria bacterium]
MDIGLNMLDLDYHLVVSRLFYALLAGGLIGLERALHGREAGFRTHMLVCVSSSLLMLLMTYQWHLIPKEFLDTVRADPSRMAQGIMTGIGFLGAGVIVKEGLSVRGLTTAASIWMTAAIGIVIGLGFYFPALITTIFTLASLSVFRWLESLLPSQKYAKFTISFLRHKEHLTEKDLLTLIHGYKIKSYSSSYKLVEEGKYFRYEMVIKSKHHDNFRKLSDYLLGLENVCEFTVSPM